MQLQSFFAVGLVAVTGVNSLGLSLSGVALTMAPVLARAAVADLPDIVIKRQELSNADLVAADLEEAGDLERRVSTEPEDEEEPVEVVAKRGEQAAEEFFAEDLGSDADE
ncbi:hypothetical protein CaCOL14_005452 [Colletotrichum acutatum]|uniref:Uncharacterized protein n=3 Tax=Colletotrichum acutatum species complex TaxID=2707335 RepID=A0A135U1E2_9PEZI|nr:uncharacterized protein COL516b_007891 [Colletotrichum fioriniae]XP_060364758.1 uncharacterized protein BDZ83DRAFT_752447 [Colletotrichum acutatum]EXF79027.1 hypothetical protein CFIO01_05787 [Colletotrichum fioriniae PJ7]KXH54152.1 hypothetical protein CSAL01_08790 [Colletotrichum salicis]KAJ0301119.1 hypothetical protein COL516b_007891 [Colletotrichum fioriniae]KAJ0317337.1 hypothetical protein COL5a_011166 [Colletotrichum fioriniae]KAJ3944907.1 hypothetical protein N0V96_004926 [Colleto